MHMMIGKFMSGPCRAHDGNRRGWQCWDVPLEVGVVGIRSSLLLLLLFSVPPLSVPHPMRNGPGNPFTGTTRCLVEFDINHPRGDLLMPQFDRCWWKFQEFATPTVDSSRVPDSSEFWNKVYPPIGIGGVLLLWCRSTAIYSRRRIPGSICSRGYGTGGQDYSFIPWLIARGGGCDILLSNIQKGLFELLLMLVVVLLYFHRTMLLQRPKDGSNPIASSKTKTEDATP